MARTAIGSAVCRVIVPAWLLAGASFKLAQLDPKLLPPVVLSTVQSMDGTAGLTGSAWMDLALRLIIVAEFIIAAIMICVPRLSRPVAVALLAFFCAILLSTILPAYRKGGFAEVLAGGCGCFGAAGPNPLYMLLIDGSMLVAALLFPVSARGQVPSLAKGAVPALALSIVGAGLAFGMPKPEVVIVEEPAADAQGGSAAGAQSAQGQGGAGAASAGAGTPAGASHWPGRPEKIESYYLAEFDTWIGKRLDAQPIMQLLATAPPETIQRGRWQVVIFRADCDHCHELMSEHFSGELEVPVLAIEVPDTDPAAALPNPCERCSVVRLLKGPSWVFTTPVLLTVQDGVVTCVATDYENPEQIEACLSR